MASTYADGNEKREFPRTIEVTFEDRNFTDLAQELGSRFAQACQDLSSKLDINPTSLTESFGDPQIFDAQGNEIDIGRVSVAAYPITFVFPLQPRKHYLLVGPTGAGKSTILGRLKLRGGHEICTEFPVAGFPVETVQLDELTSCVSWDFMSSQDRFRSILRQYYKDTIGLILVVDSSDQFQLRTAQIELMKLLTETDLQGKPLLVYSNKVDAQGSLTSKEVAARLQLPELTGCRRWSIQTASATTGSGILTGMEAMTAMAQLPRERSLDEGISAAYGGGCGDGKTSIPGGSQTKWSDTDLAEVVFECVHADGVDIKSLAPEQRSLAFPIEEGSGRLQAVVGRQHQHGFFGTLVPQHERLMSISRAHLELSWQTSMPAPTLKRLSGNPISLGDSAVGVGELATASDGTIIGFNAVNEVGPPFLVLRVRLRTRSMLKAQGVHPVVLAESLKQKARLQERGNASRQLSLPHSQSSGLLECVYAAGVDVQQLPPEAKAIGVPLGQPVEVGRMRQPGFFEQLLQAAPQWLCYLSRSHCRLSLSPSDEGELFSLAIQNLSANVVFVSGRPLGKDHGETMTEGGTLRFSAAIDGVETKFLEFVFRRADIVTL